MQDFLFLKLDNCLDSYICRGTLRVNWLDINNW